jgi:hypothetical protein
MRSGFVGEGDSGAFRLPIDKGAVLHLTCSARDCDDEALPRPTTASDGSSGGYKRAIGLNKANFVRGALHHYLLDIPKP